MPYITIEAYTGRTLEQKRELAAAITEVVARIYKTEPSAVQIRFRDMTREDVAVAGVLACDRGAQPTK